jgi:ABC-type multidrug transport system ATPase subunit
MIKTVNLTKRYGTLVALSNLNLEIHEGDCFGFIGPNGAGKSTTIKILATLLQPTWGEARVCDYVVGYQSRQIRPLIGYVPTTSAPTRTWSSRSTSTSSPPATTSTARPAPRSSTTCWS